MFDAFSVIEQPSYCADPLVLTLPFIFFAKICCVSVMELMTHRQIFLLMCLPLLFLLLHFPSIVYNTVIVPDPFLQVFFLQFCITSNVRLHL